MAVIDRPRPRGMSPTVSAEALPVSRCRKVTAAVRKTLAIASMELHKLWRDPTELATRAIQPALWLTVFGQVMSRARLIDTGGMPYLAFLVPGILAQSVLFIAIFNGISIIWERDVGVVQKLLVTPTPRAALVLGKAIGGGVRALIQAVVVLLLAILMRVHLVWNPWSLLGAAGLVLAGAMLFSTFSLVIACLVKTRERFMGVGQVLTMPLFFASNAIYPTSMMPAWLRFVAHVNPLTYQIDGLRRLILPGTAFDGTALLADGGVLIATLAVLVAIAARLYPTIVQ